MNLLSDDLNVIVNGWKGNSRATKAQRNRWPGAIKKRCLGNDDPDAICLLDENGVDRQPVFDKPHSIVKRYWYTNEYHWPLPEELIRFGLFFHIGVDRTLILIVKGYYEAYCRKKLKKERKNGGLRELYAIGTQYAQSFTVEAERMFSSESLYDLFCEQVGGYQKAGCSRKAFDLLCKHVLTSKIYLFGTEDEEVRRFIEEKENEQVIKKQYNRESVLDYEAEKLRWLNKLADLDNLLVSLEQLRLAIAQTKNRWMQHFGEKHIRLMERKHLVGWAYLIVQMKENEPELSADEIEEKVRDKVAQAKRIMDEEIEKARWAIFLARSTTGGAGMEKSSGEEQKELLKQYKKLLREIYLKTHPDAIVNNGFTEKQTKLLFDLYQDAIAIRDQELAYDTRSLLVLEDILERVHQIWRHMGVNLEPEAFLEGEDMKALLSDMEKKIGAIERREKSIKDEMYLLANDGEYLEKRDQMTDSKAIRRQHEKMDAELAELEHRLKALKERQETLFGHCR